MASSAQSRIDGFVLAGGASSRMGRPKSGVVLGGRTLLQRAVQTIFGFTGGQVSVLVGPDFADCLPDADFQIVRDLPPPAEYLESRAPIFGLRTALSVSNAEWIAVLAVDLPFVPAELLKLLAARADENVDVVVPVQPDGSIQPLCALYRRDTVLPAVEAAIAGDVISLRGMIAELRSSIVEFSELVGLSRTTNVFINVNTPEDLAQAERLLA